MNMPGRSYNEDKYNYSINGQEKTPEIAPNTTTALYWEYDSKIGGRWNLDPKPTIGLSHYATFLNNPIGFSDQLGDTTSVNFFSKSDKQSLHRAAKSEVKNQHADNVFVVYAHGSSNVIIHYDKDGKKKSILTPEDFTKAMDEKTNGNWSESLKKFKKAGKEVVVIIKACNVASNDFYDEHFGQGVVHKDITIAQQISKDLGVTVIAPDGYGLVSRDPNRPGYTGYHNQDGDAGLLTIKKGQIVSKLRIERAKPTEHALGNKRGLKKGIDSKQIIKKG